MLAAIESVAWSGVTTERDSLEAESGFGVYADVVAPGAISLNDSCTLAP